jgi:RimJ/RimL family protein N-acetyltransferase
VLRAQTPTDTADLFAIYGDPAVMEFTSDPPFPDPSSVAHLLTSVQNLFEQQQSIEWGIVVRAENRVVGTCGFHTFEPTIQRAEVGCLLARTYWRQGMMREALTSVIDWGFDSFGLQSLRADIDAPNVRSRALFTRLGFVPEHAGGTMLRLAQRDWQHLQRT